MLCLGLIISLSACKKTNLAAIEDNFVVRRNGADLPVRVYGNGSTNQFILLLHGGPGGNGLEYRTGKYAEILESKYAMAYLDQRGQGMSQGHYEEEDLSMASLAADVNAVARTLKDKYGSHIKLYLFGHSWGGTLGTAVMLNSAYAQLFEAWIEADGAHDWPLNDKGAIALFKAVGESQVTAGNSVAFWNEIISTVSAMDTNNLSSDDTYFLNSKGFEAEQYLLEVDSLSQGTESFYGSSLYGANALTNWWSGTATNGKITSYNKLDTLNYTPRLHTITTPTLFLWGKYDFVVPPIVGTTGYDNIGSPIKKFVLFEKSGHSPMNNQPEEFAQAIIDFIEGL